MKTSLKGMLNNHIEKLKECAKKHLISITIITLLFFIILVTQSLGFAVWCLILLITALVTFKLGHLLFKKSKPAFIVITSLIVFVVYCKISIYPRLEKSGYFWSEEERYFYTKVQEFKESGKKEILMKDLTNFEWENVCYLGDYDGIDENFRKIKLDKKLPSEGSGKYTIIFINGEFGKVFTPNGEIFARPRNPKIILYGSFKQRVRSVFLSLTQKDGSDLFGDEPDLKSALEKYQKNNELSDEEVIKSVNNLLKFIKARGGLLNIKEISKNTNFENRNDTLKSLIKELEEENIYPIIFYKDLNHMKIVPQIPTTSNSVCQSRNESLLKINN